MDTGAGDILTEEFTSGDKGDMGGDGNAGGSPILPEPPGQVPPAEQIGTLSNDGSQ